MNNLSCLLYFAGVVGSLQFAMIAVCVICAFALMIIPMVLDSHGEEAARKKWMHRTIAIFIACMSVAVLAPDRNTIYAIAASEYGEQVLKSNTATKAQKALDAWLDKQIADAKPEK